MSSRHLSLRTVDGFDIAAVANDTRKSDVVIWLHGIAVDKDEYLSFFRDGAQFLETEGIASIRFDFRGHGQSSGTSLDFSIIGQDLDVRSVVDYLRQHYGRRALRLHVVGASFGAPPAIFTAARYPNLVHSVCLISPVLSYRRTFLEPETDWGMELFGPDQLRHLDATGRLPVTPDFYIGHRLLEEMRLIRPDVALSALHQPVLILHGNRDSMVPYDATLDACRSLPHVRLITLDQVDHGFMVEGDDEGKSPQSLQNKLLIYRHILTHLR